MQDGHIMYKVKAKHTQEREKTIEKSYNGVTLNC